jgi:transcriptional regulator with XRE-family HTH domain
MPRIASTIAGLRRWRSRWGGKAGRAAQQGVDGPEDPLLAIGRLLRQEREARGLNLRQMALETRISTPVLEALERGWRDRLPEPAYLRTMLPLIEQRLELPGGSLGAALPASSAAEQQRSQRGRGGLLQRFTPGSIEVFSSWQGTVLYGGLTLGLIYLLNLQQQQIAAANQLSLQPIPPLPLSEQQRPPSPAAALLSRYPELQPLRQASKGQGLAALQRQLKLERQPAAMAAARRGPGVLRLNLSQPSTLQLQSEGGSRTSLTGAQGELVLQLQAPLELQIQPTPPDGAVSWNGESLPSLKGQAGRYRVPMAPASSSAPATASTPRP